MSDAIFSAYEALEARMRIVDIIANTLANVWGRQVLNATSRRSMMSGFFLMETGHNGQVLEEVVSETETNIEVVSLVDLTPGVLVTTSRALDAAIDGSGFFLMETDNGIRYTRNGSFLVNADGELVLKDGHRILGDGDTPIFVGQGQVRVQDGGDISVDGNVVGALRIVEFDDTRYLRKEGLFRYEWTGDPTGVTDVLDPRVKGAHLEKSNVNSVSEMIELINSVQ